MTKNNEEPSELIEKCDLCKKELNITKITFYGYNADNEPYNIIICDSCNSGFIAQINSSEPFPTNSLTGARCCHCNGKKSGKWITWQGKVRENNQSIRSILIFCSVICKNKHLRKLQILCGSCDLEMNPKTRLMCDACKSKYYCSPECQKKHWPNHKKGCKQEQVERKYDPDSEEAKYTCCLCFKRSTKEMNHCARCKKYRYCSSECQKKDWPAHKKICMKIEEQ